MRILLIIGLLFSSLLLGIQASTPVPTITPEIQLLTIENVVIVLKEAEVQHIDIVLRQVKLETGNLQSSLAIDKNNLFGFRTKSYMKFSSWQESIYYYKKWQDRKYKGGDYYTFLKKIGYAEDMAYIDKLKQIKHKQYITELIKS